MVARDVCYAWSGTKPSATDGEEQRTELIDARARLRLTEEQVLRQARAVEQLKAEGRDASEAEQLLRTLEDGLRVANDLLSAREDLLTTTG
jgi:hypothetical protein